MEGGRTLASGLPAHVTSATSWPKRRNANHLSFYAGTSANEVSYMAAIIARPAGPGGGGPVPPVPGETSKIGDAIGAAPDRSGLEEPRRWSALYILVFAYLLLDYGRPQDTIPGVGAIRPAMVVTILLAISLLVNWRSRVLGSIQQWCVWAFLLLLGIWIPLARNNYFAYHAWLAMLSLLPLVFALPVCVDSVSRLRRTFGFCLLLMAYQAAFSLTHGGNGTGAQFADQNDLSLYLNTYLPFAYFFFLVSDLRAFRRLFYLAAIVTALAAIVYSGSRGGFVGLLAMAGATWLFGRRKIAALVLVGVLAVGVAYLAPDAYWKRIATASDTEQGTARERLESWKSGWNMFVHNPLGVGGDNFQVRFSQYQTEYFQRGMWGRVAHSLWVTLLTELGIPGVLIYGLLLFSNLRESLRIRRIGRAIGGDDGRFLSAMGSAFLASMAGFFASATFLSVLYYPHYWYLTGFIVATGSVARKLGQVRTIPA